MGRSSEEESEDELPPIIVKREEWKARKPKTTKRISGPVPDVVYTETDTRECKSMEDCSRLLRDIQTYHMDVRGLPDIQHHFMVASDGTVYEGRGWDVHGPTYTKSDPMPQHLSGNSIEVAFIGKYKDKEPPEVMIKASNNLIRLGMNLKKITQRASLPEDEEEEDENLLNLIPEDKKKVKTITAG